MMNANDMPLLPGLAGQGAAAPAGLSFNDLTAEEVAQLVQAASSEAPPMEGDAEAMDAEHEGENGAGAPGALPPGIELTEEQQGMIDSQAIAAVGDVCAADCQASLDQLAGMLESAEAAEDGDPKAIKKIIKDAEKVKANCDKALEKVKAAAEAGKVEKAQEAVEACEEACTEMADLVAQAQAIVDAQAPEMVPAGSEAAAGAPPGAAPAPAAAPHPLSTWAKS